MTESPAAEPWFDRIVKGLSGASPAMADVKKRQWYNLRNAAKDDPGPAELLIYDEIDSWFGVSAEQLARDIATIDSEREIVARINSPGGNIFDGIAILNALRGHKGKVTTIVDGVAASIASVIAMAGDEIVMNRNSEMMVHNGHGVVVGDAKDMLKMAEVITTLNANIASIYAEKAGGTTDDWLAIMAEETWYTADEAVTAGLADRVETKTDASKAKAKFDFAVFNHAGRSKAPAPRIPLAHTQTPQPVEAEVTDKSKEGGLMPTLQEGLAELFGTAPDADDEIILAAAKEALDERASSDDGAGSDEAVEPTIEQATQVAAKFGAIVVDKAAYEQMTATVNELAAARAVAVADDDERKIQNALATGRIDPNTADTWRTELAKNRDSITTVLATLPANSAVAVAEIGHGVASEDTNIDAEMASMYVSVTGQNLGKDA